MYKIDSIPFHRKKDLGLTQLKHLALKPDTYFPQVATKEEMRRTSKACEKS